jgi:penicillin-binding protein 1A
MASAVAIDHRRGPPLPPEFRMPERRPEPTKKSPLPEDWSDGTKALREIGNLIDDLIGGK